MGKDGQVIVLFVFPLSGYSTLTVSNVFRPKNDTKYFKNASFETGLRGSIMADAEAGGSARKSKFPVATTIPSNEEKNNEQRRRKVRSRVYLWL